MHGGVSSSNDKAMACWGPDLHNQINSTLLVQSIPYAWWRPTLDNRRAHNLTLCGSNCD
jgi:hypothetical protein